MPYNANSRSQQRVRVRLDAVEHGGDPDDATGEAVALPEPTPLQVGMLAEMANGAGLRAAGRAVTGRENSISYAHASVSSPSVTKPMHRELEKAGLTAAKIARRIAREVKHLDSDDISERALALKALTLACKLRGDLIPVAPAASGGPPSVAINMLIQVMRELQEPPAVVVERTDNDDVNGHAPQPSDKVG